MQFFSTSLLLSLSLVQQSNAFQPAPHSPVSPPSQRFLFDSVEAAIADAQRICAQDGHGSPACRVAWDIVEELEAADAHKDGPMQQAPVGAPVAPDTAALFASFDILVQKIDGKMEQLKATTAQFHTMGAMDPALEELYRQAEQMQQTMAQVRDNLRR